MRTEDIVAYALLLIGAVAVFVIAYRQKPRTTCLACKEPIDGGGSLCEDCADCSAW